MEQIDLPSNDKVAIGFASRVRGVKGEMVIQPLTDDLERFSQLKSVLIFLSGKYKSFDIENSRKFKDRMLVKLAGIDTPEEAKKLVNSYLEIEKKEIPPLPKGKYYVFNIIGLKVKTVKGENFGEIKEVISYPANDVYVISRSGKEYDLPATKEIIKRIDLKKREMVIQLLPGLWDWVK